MSERHPDEFSEALDVLNLLWGSQQFSNGPTLRLNQRVAVLALYDAMRERAENAEVDSDYWQRRTFEIPKSHSLTPERVEEIAARLDPADYNHVADTAGFYNGGVEDLKAAIQRELGSSP